MRGSSPKIPEWINSQHRHATNGINQVVMKWLKRRQEYLADVGDAAQEPSDAIERPEVRPEVQHRVGELLTQVQSETGTGELETSEGERSFVEGKEISALESEAEFWNRKTDE